MITKINLIIKYTSKKNLKTTNQLKSFISF